MANEYLKRTPTSTGNRKVFTWAGWQKTNSAPIASSEWYALFSAGDFSSSTPSLAFNNIGGSRVALFQSSAYNSYKFTTSTRDVSSWRHMMMVVDTTKGDDEDRLNVYINGVRQATGTFSATSINYDTGVNLAGQIHQIGAYLNSGSLISLAKEVTSDIFFVDGQALSPDVFGFYKDGDGYVSVGSTQATDFRPGQWMPHSPTKIKKDINRRGGFGVNGFYLPMNDSSNPGADFHCAPNSIITLKGEDLPQPRNGAPTTTDAYVSQLRSDPFAANLVLAIPFITGGRDSGAGDYSADIKGSGTNKTVTVNGTFSVGDCSSYYGSALKGSSGNRHVAVSAHSDFANLYDVDHTIEFWYKNDSWNGGYLPHQDIIANRHSTNNVAWRISFTDKNNTEDGIQLFGSNGFSSGANTLNNDWNHCAVEQQNGATTIYINGVAAGRNDNKHGYQTYKASTGPIIIGSDGRSANLGDTYSFNGQIQDLRIYKGVAKYKGGFDVPKPYTPVGIEEFRTTADTCKNNFATLNPLLGIGRQDQLTYSDGNLKVVSGATGGTDTTAASNIAIKGKIYCEFYLADDGLGAYVGVMKSNTNLTNNGTDTTASSDCWIIRGDNEHKANGGGGSGTSYGSGTFSDGDIIMIAVDIDNTSIWWGKNGTWYASGNPATNSNAAYTNLPSSDDLLVICGDNYSSETPTINVNFGQNPSFSGTTTAGTNADDSGKGLFKYAPPSGFLALCEDNLPTPAIADPGKHFKTVLWTGDGSSGRSITGVGFKPDLVWFKGRNASVAHVLNDTVRGIREHLNSDSNNAAQTPTYPYLNSVDNDGFSLVGGSSSGGNVDGRDIVAWCWKAGGAAVSNSDGSITSQVSVNQTAGFSIVKFTGQGGSSSATVGHGLGKKPAFWIYKPHTNTTNWYMYHQSLGASAWLQFTNGAATTSNPAAWGGVEPTSTVLTHGSGLVNQGSCILYAWAEIEGYSKFGSYTGNNSADGPFVYCGFKPAWVLIKKTNGSGNENWRLFDSSRCSTNQNNKHLLPSTSNAESTETGMDFLSNGFKLRDNDAHQNQDGTTYIFAAFAESPFQTANAK